MEFDDADRRPSKVVVPRNKEAKGKGGGGNSNANKLEDPLPIYSGNEVRKI